MANNIVPINAYQLNQHTIPLNAVTTVGFPVGAVLLGDCINSPTRSLPTGVNVYSWVQTASGDKYYCRETFSALAALFNA